jgi:protein TonB
MVSLVLHAGLAWAAMRTIDYSALASGSGNDDFVIEQGVAIEGVAMFGLDTETVQAVEAEPVEMSEARPEVKEVKTEEVVEEAKVITSETGPEQEQLSPEVEEKAEQVKQVAATEQVAVQEVEEKIAAGAQQQGGDSTVLKAYNGKLFAHISKKIVRPRTGQRVGRVVVRMLINPTGDVISREVAESSGIKGIDEAALASIDKASPFPPIPSDVASGPLERTVPFRYRVE